MNPYMDPAYFFYATQAMAAAAYGMGMMPYGPYGMPMMPPTPAFGPPLSTSRHLPDDQQSIQSYHYDLDNRSEKKHPLMMNANRAHSIMGDGVAGGVVGFKSEPVDSSKHHQMSHHHQKGLLLMEDPGGDPTNASGIIESVGGGGGGGGVGGGASVGPASAAKENRMTPLTHQLPHVRASFALNAMIKVRANDPCEGQPALVDIINLGDMMEHFLSNLKNMKSSECNYSNFFFFEILFLI